MKSFKLSTCSKIAPNRQLKIAFSLPAKLSCPGKTRACTACYVTKGNHQYPSVKKLLAHNFKLWRGFESDNNLKGLVASLINTINWQHSGPIFRVHESGDLRNEFSVKAWYYVAKALPNKAFTCYTRSHWLTNLHLLTSLPNFHLFLSVDEYNEHTALQALNNLPNARLAYGPCPPGTVKPNSFTCPATGNGKLHGVAGACQKCRLCYSSKSTKNVVFIKH